MSFASRLQELRQRATLSQSELARKVGISVDCVQNWEQGRRTPNLASLVQLALGLGVSIDVLAEMQAPRKKKM